MDDGCELCIPRNLFDLVRRIRHSTGESKVLWAEAICINQTDLEQRSHPVGMMKEIYNSCEEVLIWLRTVAGPTSTVFASSVLDLKTETITWLSDGSNLSILKRYWTKFKKEEDSR